MNLIRNNESFDQGFDFQGGVQLKHVARMNAGGSVASLDLEDKHGNILQIRSGQYSGIDIYTKQQVKRYKLHGTVDGCRIEQLFDDEDKAQDQLRRFQQLARHAEERGVTANVDLQVDEVMVADN